jgi:peptide/nickel transport system permease protein
MRTDGSRFLQTHSTPVTRLFSGCLTRLLVTLIAVTILFFTLRLLPGDAIAAQLIPAGATTEQIASRRAELGVDDPFYEQYARFILGLFRADLGESLSSGQPVLQMIGQQIGPTTALALTALIVSVVLGLLMGFYAGMGQGTFPGILSRVFIGLSLGMPIFWTGILAILLFSLALDWFPATGSGRFEHLVLPAAVLGFHTSGAIALVTQSSIRQTLTADFIRTAYSKGLRQRRILVGHVMRAGLIPVIGVIALQAGFLFSGVVVTETLFVRPGLGRLLLDATMRRDYPVIQGVVLLTLVIFTLVNLLADLLYTLVDPRVRKP